MKESLSAYERCVIVESNQKRKEFIYSNSRQFKKHTSFKPSMYGLKEKEKELS